MIKALVGHSKGLFAVTLMATSTLLHFFCLVLTTIGRILVPTAASRRLMTRIAIAVATNWVRLNNLIFDTLYHIEWVVTGDQDLNPDDWYLVTCNHQSWSDIPVCQKLMVDQIPMLKFFLKQELIWVPILGLCWWALDFPFMKRYSPGQIKRNPKLAGKDLETTREACEKFKTTPVSIFNFIEGTRLTTEKHRQQESPFKHLLKPKAGGAAFVLGSMGDYLHTLIDISIVYPDEHYGIWDLCSGRIRRVRVDIRKVTIPPELLSKDYQADEEFKRAFQLWLNQLWLDKDARLEAMKAEIAAEPKARQS